MRPAVRFLLHLSVVVAAVAMLHGAGGARWSAIGAAAGALYLAWRFDNRTGTWLMLTMLVVVVLAILIALVAALTMFGG